MNTPTPPPGHKLVKGIDIKDHVPEGALYWEEFISAWEPSLHIGKPLSRAWHQNTYAIPSEPESITDEAKTIVAGDRASDYGDASESFTRIAKLWSAYTGTNISPWDVAQMMILLKVSRAKTSRKRDTLVDIVGYAECASQLTTASHPVA
jgi:hypothetical protein